MITTDSIHTEEIVLGADGLPVGAQPVRKHWQPTPAEVLSWLPKNATPAQQDSAIQAHIRPSEITWSQQPDTLHLPGHTRGHSWRDINLPQYYRESYFTGKPYFNPDLFGGRTGVAGDPVPYSIARDNLITLLLLFCFCIALIAYTKSRRFILRQAKEFFRPPVSENMTTVTETSEELRFQFFLVLQSCLLLGLIYFFYTQLYVADTFLVDQYQVIGILSLTMLGYMLVKTMLYWLVGWVFFDKRNNEFWMKSYLFFLAMEGVCLFPVVMLNAYFKMPVRTTLVCTFLVITLFKLLSLYKSYIIFFRHRGGFLQNFLYFCTLELTPLAVLLGTLTTIVNCLKVNF
ncbi:DUF4271 domain-containing protein [Leyella stercorea]|uniref:DUF4271 domain-containing protein n=1 Tax=Leyella stercorea TaxID=363265 RepID=UPI00242C21BD|nr:DUF4271 domain-containing protein [Leyella stercorea]